MAVREFAAARLASNLGDKARAEQASRRLIGVRLDTDAQIELAKLLRSLGMNDMAADVVRRMRGRTGGNSSQLQTLLTYFSSQGEKEAAAEVAMELLQRTAPTPKRPGSSVTLVESQRTQALQALAESGKLQKLVESTRERMERSPNSQRVRMELAEMYRVTGQVKEMDALLSQGNAQKNESAVALDARAKELVRGSKWSEACDIYLKLLRRNPQLMTRQFNEFDRAFTQAKRHNELVSLMLEVGVQRFDAGRSADLCQRLARNQSTQDAARQLFQALLVRRDVGRPLFTSMSNTSSALKSLITDEATLAKVMDLCIELSTAQTGNAWSELLQGYSTNGEGRKTNGLTALVQQMSRDPNMAELMEKRLQAELAKRPEWSEGKVWLGLLMAARKRPDQAKELLEPIIDHPLEGGRDALWLIASQIDSIPDLQALADKAYQLALKEEAARPVNVNDSNDFQYSLTARVSNFMLERGQKEAAKELVLAHIEKKRDNSKNTFNDPDYEAYRLVNDTYAIMGILSKADAPLDALKLARKLDRSNFEKAERFSGNSEETFNEQVRLIETQVKKLGGLVLLESTVEPETKNEHCVELGISMEGYPFTSAGFKSLWHESMLEVITKPELNEPLTKFVGQLMTLSQARPQDPSLRVALALATARPESKELLDQLVTEGWPAEAPAESKESDAAKKPASKVDNLPANQWRAQALAMAYLHWLELERLKSKQQGRPEAINVASIKAWFEKHAQTWPALMRLHFWATLGRSALASQDKVAAEALWRESLQTLEVDIAKVLDLAIAAARENMIDLSIEAAIASTKAAENPVQPNEGGAKPASSLGQLLGADQRSTRAFANPFGGTMTASSISTNAQTRPPLMVIDLDKTWTTKSVPAEKLIEPLSKLVDLNEKVIQPLDYALQESATTSGWLSDSVFDHLARRAAQCQQTESLVTKILGEDHRDATPELLAKADVQRSFLVALAWLRAERGDKAVDYLKSIGPAALTGLNQTIVCQTLVAAMEDAACRNAAVDLALAYMNANKPSGRTGPTTVGKLAKEVVRKTVTANMAPAVRAQAISIYLDITQVENQAFGDTAQPARQASQLQDVAQMLLTGGQTVEALKYLSQRQLLFSQGGDRTDDWVGSWTLENIHANANRQEAYQLLLEWTFQGDANLNSIQAFARRAPLPAWIPEVVSGEYPTFAPIVEKEVPLVTSYYSLALLSEEVQRADELLAKYAAAREQRRQGATVGLAITLAALKRPVPEEMLKEITHQVQGIRPDDNMTTPRTAAPLGELHLALILLSHGQQTQWASEMIAEVRKHGTPLGRLYINPWLARFEALQGRSEFKSLVPVKELKHWKANITATARLFYEGLTPRLWLTDHESQLAHVSGFGIDSMWWRYPLEGNFAFEFETLSSKTRELELFVSGIKLQVSTTHAEAASEDRRDWLQMNPVFTNEGEWKKHKLSFDERKMRYTINDTLCMKSRVNPCPYVGHPSRGDARVEVAQYAFYWRAKDCQVGNIVIGRESAWLVRHLLLAGSAFGAAEWHWRRCCTGSIQQFRLSQESSQFELDDRGR